MLIEPRESSGPIKVRYATLYILRYFLDFTYMHVMLCMYVCMYVWMFYIFYLSSSSNSNGFDWTDASGADYHPAEALFGASAITNNENAERNRAYSSNTEHSVYTYVFVCMYVYICTFFNSTKHYYVVLKFHSYFIHILYIHWIQDNAHINC